MSKKIAGKLVEYAFVGCLLGVIVKYGTTEKIQKFRESYDAIFHKTSNSKPTKKSEPKQERFIDKASEHICDTTDIEFWNDVIIEDTLPEYPQSKSPAINPEFY